MNHTDTEIEIFQNLLNGYEEPSFLISEEICLLNNNLLKILKYQNSEEFSQKAGGSFDFLDAIDQSAFRKKLQETAVNRKSATGKYHLLNKKGQPVLLKLNISCIRDNSRNYVWLCRGISEEFDKIDETILHFFNTDKFLDEVLLITDFKGNIITANRKLLIIDFFADLADKKFNLFAYIDPLYKDILNKRILMLKKGNPIPPCEYKLVQEDGKSAYIEVHSKCITYKGQKVIVSLVRDITLRKESEKKLLYSIIQTEEKERQRFAHDLHDELGPFLSALKLYISELQSSDTDPDNKQLLFDYLHEMINEAVDKIKTISKNLAPQNLIEEGLTSFVRKMINRVRQTGKVKIEFTTRGNDSKIEPSFVITLYRILLELINNSLKHAQSRNIHIALIYGKKVRLIYTDDGLGYDLEKQISLGKGIGLKSILNRIELYQGNYKFQHLKPSGIEFDIIFPLK